MKVQTKKNTRDKRTLDRFRSKMHRTRNRQDRTRARPRQNSPAARAHKAANGITHPGQGQGKGYAG